MAKEKDKKKDFLKKLEEEKKAKDKEQLTIAERVAKTCKEGFKHYGRTKKTRFLPSGILPFDLTLSTSMQIDMANKRRIPLVGNGIPSGFITMIYGKFGCGKSSLAGSFLAKAQQLGGIAILIDHETGNQKSLLQCCGVDLDRLLHIIPDNMEESLNTIRTLIQDYQTSDVPICIVVDSVPAMVSREVQGEAFEKAPMVARSANLMARFLNEIRADLGFCDNVYLIFINQLRSANIGARTMPGMPAADNYPCKDTLNFMSDIIIKMVKKETEKDKKTDTIENVLFQAEFKKNKRTGDLRKVELPFYVSPDSMVLGLDDATACRDYCINNNLWKREGNSYIVNGEKLSPDKIRKALLTDQDFYQRISKTIIDHYLITRGFDLGGVELNGETESEEH